MNNGEVMDEADVFLFEHDSYFRDKKKKKSRGVDYPYLTPSQIKQVGKREVPFSSLSMKQRLACEDGGCSLESFVKD